LLGAQTFLFALTAIIMPNITSSCGKADSEYPIDHCKIHQVISKMNKGSMGESSFGNSLKNYILKIPIDK
jgi:hypothetical protein